MSARQPAPSGWTGAAGFDAAAWRAQFDASRAAAKYGHLARLRTDVQKGTLPALKSGSYVDSAGADVPLAKTRMEAGRIGAKMYSEKTLCSSPRLRSSPDDSAAFGGTAVCIQEADCLECAGSLLSADPGSHVAVLNMANAFNPGGGWLAGSGAQEENLHRRTNLSDHLSNFRNLKPENGVKYPIPEIGGIFSPDVCVLRGSEAAGYPFLPEPFFLSVLSVAAYSHPQLVRRRLAPKPESGTRRKIGMMLRMAKHHRVDHVVLSAFGCGAFDNPPMHVAELFRDSLSSEEFAGQFRSATFAIIEDHNSRKVWAKGVAGNVAPFRLVLGAEASGPSTLPAASAAGSEEVGGAGAAARDGGEGDAAILDGKADAAAESADDEAPDEVRKEVSAEMVEWGQGTFRA